MQMPEEQSLSSLHVLNVLVSPGVPVHVPTSAPSCTSQASRGFGQSKLPRVIRHSPCGGAPSPSPTPSPSPSPGKLHRLKPLIAVGVHVSSAAQMKPCVQMPWHLLS